MANCSSPNHQARSRTALDPWTCLGCKKTFCTSCEGCADEDFEYCDTCWDQRRKEKEDKMKARLVQPEELTTDNLTAGHYVGPQDRKFTWRRFRSNHHRVRKDGSGGIAHVFGLKWWGPGSLCGATHDAMPFISEGREGADVLCKGCEKKLKSLNVS